MARRRETDSVLEQPSQEEAGFAAPSTQSTSTPQSASAPQSEPTTQQIAQRAYEIYQARGGTEGQDIEDWLQAERELRRGLQPGE
jgi:DUF2934 family protein